MKFLSLILVILSLALPLKAHAYQIEYGYPRHFQFQMNGPWYVPQNYGYGGAYDTSPRPYGLYQYPTAYGQQYYMGPIPVLPRYYTDGRIVRRPCHWR